MEWRNLQGMVEMENIRREMGCGMECGVGEKSELLEEGLSLAAKGSGATTNLISLSFVTLF